MFFPSGLVVLGLVVSGVLPFYQGFVALVVSGEIKVFSFSSRSLGCAGLASHVRVQEGKCYDNSGFARTISH